MPWRRHLPQCLGVYPNIVPTTVMMQLASMLTEMFLKVPAFHIIARVDMLASRAGSKMLQHVIHFIR